jgi:hypothetical protein
MGTPPADIHHQKTADKRTDGDMVTLITAAQQIMTDLQIANTEQDSSVVIVRAVYGLVMLK